MDDKDITTVTDMNNLEELNIIKLKYNTWKLLDRIYDDCNAKQLIARRKKPEYSNVFEDINKTYTRKELNDKLGVYSRNTLKMLEITLDEKVSDILSEKQSDLDQQYLQKLQKLQEVQTSYVKNVQIHIDGLQKIFDMKIIKVPKVSADHIYSTTLMQDLQIKRTDFLEKLINKDFEATPLISSALDSILHNLNTRIRDCKNKLTIKQEKES